MSRVLTIAPCPFCEGPSVVRAVITAGGGEVFAGHRRKSGELYQAYVACHACGCRGPLQASISIRVFERVDLTVGQLMRRAVQHWNARFGRARALYNLCASLDQNRYLRP